MRRCVTISLQDHFLTGLASLRIGFVQAHLVSFRWSSLRGNGASIARQGHWSRTEHRKLPREPQHARPQQPPNSAAALPSSTNGRRQNGSDPNHPMTPRQVPYVAPFGGNRLICMTAAPRGLRGLLADSLAAYQSGIPKPVFDSQVWHSGELSGVIGNDHRIQASCMRCYEKIVVANHLAFAFQAGSDTAIVPGSLFIP